MLNKKHRIQISCVVNYGMSFGEPRKHNSFEDRTSSVPINHLSFSFISENVFSTFFDTIVPFDLSFLTK